MVTNDICFQFFFLKEASDEEPEISDERGLKNHEIQISCNASL